MANFIYDKGREAFLGPSSGQINWTTDTIRISRTTSASQTASNQFRSSLTGEQSASTGTLGTKTVTDGVADAADVTFAAVNDGTTASLEIWKRVGADDSTPGDDPLIAHIDTATGLPVSTNGGDITVTWDNGANKIFKL